MKLNKLLISTFGALAFSTVHAAPIVVTPGSVAGYLYVPVVISGVAAEGDSISDETEGSIACNVAIKTGKVSITVPTTTEIEYDIVGGAGSSGVSKTVVRATLAAAAVRLAKAQPPAATLAGSEHMVRPEADITPLAATRAAQ